MGAADKTPQDPTAPATVPLADSPAGPTPGDARLSAPSALRNREAILYELMRFAPAQGRALEIASGTGEHVIRFAAATPSLVWQPSDPNADRHASISAWTAAAGLANILPPRDLDASRPDWAAEMAPVDLVVLSNLLHLISAPAAASVLLGMADVLAPGGIALVYGPFLRDGQVTSDGDKAFDASLRAQNPETGYKDVAWACAQMSTAGLRLLEHVAMPANNLLLAFAKD